MTGRMEFMNQSSGNELDELLGAYALDAVDGDERRRVEEYLAVNPRAAAEVQDHREVATMLAFTGMDAPADLWSRIESELDATDDAPPPGPQLARVLGGHDEPAGVRTVHEPVPPSGDVRSLDEARSRRFGRVGPFLLGAAAACVVAVGAVVVLGDEADAPTDPIAEAYQLASADRDSVTAELVAEGSAVTAIGVIDEDGHGYLEAGTLPTLSADQTYQLWGVLADTEDVVSLGILGPNPELETFTVEGDVAALAITIEDAPGVIADGNPVGAYVGTLG